MNQQLSNIELLIQQSELTEEEKQKLLKEISNADKQWNILEFKLNRIEKVKKTTAVLLEETIEELEKKRKDVEAKNKELEIQNALERVRAVALGMKEPADMLEICKTISQQLQLLNVKEIRNVQTAIFYEGEGTYMNYEYYAKHDKTFTTETTYTNNEIHNAFANQMLKGNGEFFITHIKGDEVKDWIAYQKTTNVFIDDYLNTATSLNYYWYSLGAVALGISTYEPLKDEDIDLFKRFLKVFELSYTRYLDIEQAEAQAREAQIQLALERIRARTMAMQKSNELADTAAILFSQFKNLGYEPDRITIGIMQEEKHILDLWATSGDADEPRQFYQLPVNEPHVLAKCVKAWKEQKRSLVLDLYGQPLKEYTEFWKSFGATQDARRTIDQVVFNFAFFSKGYLGFISFEHVPSQTIELLERFAGVFDLTYTRFLDLQKAEAQAQEARVEAALEKVRSRSLAVYKSDEFNEVIKVVFEKLQELEIPMTSASINVIIEGSKDVEAYICGQGKDGITLSHIRLIHFNHPISNDRYDAYEKGLEFFTKTYNAEEKNSFYQYEFEVSDLKYIPDDIKRMVMESKRYTISMALNKKSMIVVNDFEGKPLSSQQIDIVKRFSKVFEQAYIRFLDLQKAEAQARESEIELGLERVRSRAMAMQTSEELNALIGTVFTELTKLDLVLTRCVILIYEGNEKGVRWWMANSETPSTPMNFFVKYADMPFCNEYLKGWYNRALKWQYCLEDENKIKTDDFLFNETELSLLPDFVIEGMKAPDRVYLNASFNNFGNLTLATLQPLSEEHFNILLRFAKVFDLTYTRFNDLQKAEAQAREAEIQLALERVRARTMAMQKQNDLLDVLHLLVEQLIKLGVHLEIANFSNGIPSDDWDLWIEIVTDDGTIYNNYVHFPRIDHPYFHHVEKNIEIFRNGGADLFQDVFSKEEKDSWQDYINTQTIFKDLTPQEHKQIMYDKTGYTWSMILLKDTWVSICRFNTIPFGDKENELFRRFANAFGQAYTRFLDLQNAEAQAREAQIETALEKVRSRTMGMQKSEELKEVIQLVYEQFVQLKINVEHTGFIIDYKARSDMHIWLADQHEVPFEVTIPYFDCAHWNSFIKAKEKGEDFFANCLSFEEKNKFYNDLFNLIPGVPDETKNYYLSCPGLAISTVLLDNVGLYIENFSGTSYSNEENAVLMRFGKVFQQTYTRFLDLQKAEAQAREAQIETSLERVRSKTMAMHNSADVGETVAALFDELKKLGIETIRCGIGIMQNTKTMEVWTAKPNENNKIDLIIGHLDMNLHPLLQGAFKGWSNKEKSFAYELKQDDLINYFTAINNHPAYPVQYNIATLPSTIYHNDFFFSEGTLFAFSLTQLSDENKKICKRFSAVFGQTYRRYLDLKKAEAQAREAQIEAALERVRAKAMAMQNSNDLSIAASMVFTELRKLGINPIRYGVGLLNKESRKAQLYSVTSSSDGDSLSLVGWVMLAGHTVLENIYDTWLKNEDYYPELTGEQLKSYYENLLAGLSLPTVPNWQTTEKQYGHFLSFSVGCLYAWSNRHYSDSEIKILKRFATIIDLTFRRYLELQTSEANTREAIKQAALDRIRADIASMRTVSDLNRITPLIWNELTILGIPFIRCGVFIMNDEQQLIYTFLSTPDGKAIAAFHIPYNTLGNIKHVLSHWHDKKNYIDHWDENAFTEFAATLVTQGALTSSTQYLKTIPHGGFYLHFLPFLQGMLYVGNTTQLGEEEINLIQSVADAFSTAYARYEDFNKLEAAKQQIEKTLTDLKQTQQQLVQSEKMASLGELTAGIAHEIQNPLNFVNNFSEVSKELIDEMRMALENGDKQEAEQIANDIILNLEKINHHGKRADAIVKNMLQHSRKNSGQKEPTDINALCDEYLRLSFHGMRAKDKNFNADFKTDFDNSIGKINVVPQDIGRVLLNLYNNAFYAVNEKKRLLANSYQPTAEVKTRRINDKVEIIISDNGNGIPQNIVDKIFQPFFTTKPTGEGTGLGLSLAYDIITKEHNGTIKVESKEDEGSEFIIQLPIQVN